MVACGVPAQNEVPCLNDSIMSHACVLQLPRTGGMRVPPRTLVSALGSNPDGSELVLPDSTVVEIWVTEYPAGGLAAAGGFRTDSIVHSDTTVSGYTTSISTVKLLPPVGAPVYVGLAHVTIDTGTAVNLSVSTATPSSRDRSLLEVLSWLRLVSK